MNNNRRHKNIQEMVNKALNQKPTADSLRKRGLRVDEIEKMFGGTIPQNIAPITTKVVKGRRGGKNKFHEARRSRNKGVSREPFHEPTTIEIPTPDWFKIKDKIDVSIIVPLYKSKSVILEQINNWDRTDDGLTKEIIYVDDNCPDNSYQVIVNAWESKKMPVGRVFRNNSNGGFAYACNIGAKHALGEYLIFLNADIIVSRNWVKPMIRVLEKKPDVGLVGNLQTTSDGETIESAGSEWSWSMDSFPHLGRGIKLKDAPRYLLEPGEREMITAACIVIPKDFFYEIGGFDTQYRIGYWEDSDLCMEVHRAGKKIFYTPESKVIHKVGHSGACNHPYMQANKYLFKHRWVDSGIIDQWISHPRSSRPRKQLKNHFQGQVIGCVIVCNEEEFLEVSVDSVSSLVDRWVIVVGGNEYAYKAGMCKADGYPTDHTLDIAHKLVKKYGGIVVEPPKGRVWHDKIEMRNAYAQHLSPGDWMFLLDGDEVYKDNQLMRVAELMRTHEVLIMQFWVFWNNVNTIGTGKWDQYNQERVVKWKEGYHYAPGQHLYVATKYGKLVKDIVPCWRGNDRLFYHYSWVRSIEKIRQKLKYYKYQTGLDNDRYVDDIFLKWRELPDLMKGRTHPMGGGDFAAFNGFHPPGVQRLIKAGKLNF